MTVPAKDFVVAAAQITARSACPPSIRIFCFLARQHLVI
jgi:hypothetical protein